MKIIRILEYDGDEDAIMQTLKGSIAKLTTTKFVMTQTNLSEEVTIADDPETHIKGTQWQPIEVKGQLVLDATGRVGANQDEPPQSEQ